MALLPFIPEGVAIIPPISNGLSDLITSEQARRQGDGHNEERRGHYHEERRLPEAVPIQLRQRSAEKI